MIISIITVNLNNLTGLCKTMASVLSQDLRFCEWIVIDGGSDDGSVQLIEENAHSISYWVSEPDRGIYHAMNKGVDAAHGDYLIFMNSGDSFTASTIIAEFVAMQTDVDVVYGNAIFVDDKGHEVKRRITPDTLQLSYFWCHWLNHQSMFFHRRCFTHFRYDDQLQVEGDLSLTLNLLMNGYAFEKWDRFVTFYLTGGISSKYPDLASERQSVLNKILPPVVKADFDELGYLYEIDLFRIVHRIIHSSRWVRQLARIALLPFHFITK